MPTWKYAYVEGLFKICLYGRKLFKICLRVNNSLKYAYMEELFKICLRGRTLSFKSVLNLQLTYLYIVSLPERKHFNIYNLYTVSLNKQPQCLKHTGSVFNFYFNKHSGAIIEGTRVLKNRRLYINIK